MAHSLATVWILAACITAAQTPSMPSESLAEFETAWEEAYAAKDAAALFGLVASVSAYGENAAGRRTWSFRYSDASIQARIIDLYIAMTLVRARHAAPEIHEFLLDKYHDIESVELDFGSISEGEYLAEASDMVAALAESTFSEEFYWCAWLSFLRSEHKMAYLARVKPDTTLALILDNAESAWEQRELREMLFRFEPYRWFFVSDAFEILVHMARHSPETLQAQRERVVEFISNYGLFYAPNGVHASISGKYLEGWDYIVRVMALELLLHVGTVDELPLVNDLAENPPSIEMVRASRRRLDALIPEDLPTKVQTVSAHLRQQDE